MNKFSLILSTKIFTIPPETPYIYIYILNVTSLSIYFLLLETSWPVQACNGIDLPLLLPLWVKG